MKHLVKIYEETKKLNIDLTQYEFSTDFLNKKQNKIKIGRGYEISSKSIREACYSISYV